jgi:hypothetical protein
MRRGARTCLLEARAVRRSKAKAATRAFQAFVFLSNLSCAPCTLNTKGLFTPNWGQRHSNWGKTPQRFAPNWGQSTQLLGKTPQRWTALTR